MNSIEDEAALIRRELTGLWRCHSKGRHRNHALYDALFFHSELDLDSYLYRLRRGPMTGLAPEFMLFRAIFDSRVAPYLHDTASLDRRLLRLIERFDTLHAQIADVLAEAEQPSFGDLGAGSECGEKGDV